MNFRSTPVIRYYFWAGLSLIFIFAMLNPAGTRDSGLHIRLATWAFNVGILLFLMIRLHLLLQSIHIFNYLNPWAQLTLSGMFGSVVFVPFGVGIDYIFGLDDWSNISSYHGAISIFFNELKGVLFPATLTWIAINAPRIIKMDFTEIEVKTPGHDKSANRLDQADETNTLNTFMTVIPREIGTDIIYLKSELHYIRVVTSKGERLVLFNLKDAITDVEKTVRGIQTHRSYWVAVDHIKQMISGNNQKFIITSTDVRIPVSRRKSVEVKKFITTCHDN
jgi:hypothetical protein